MQQPAWLQENVKEDSKPLKEPEESIQQTTQFMSIATTASSSTSSQKQRKLLFWVLKIVTISLCMLMVITGGIGLTEIDGFDAIGSILVAIYMMFFGSLLLCFEITQIRPVESVDFMLRRNFGFLYGAKGKAFFILFIAFLSFGLEKPASLAMTTGILFAGLGGSEVVLYLQYPEMFEDD
jgi:hypothetical protein